MVWNLGVPWFLCLSRPASTWNHCWDPPSEFRKGLLIVNPPLRTSGTENIIFLFLCIYFLHTKSWALLTTSWGSVLWEILFSGIIVYRLFSCPFWSSFLPVVSVSTTTLYNCRELEEIHLLRGGLSDKIIHCKCSTTSANYIKMSLQNYRTVSRNNMAPLLNYIAESSWWNYITELHSSVEELYKIIELHNIQEVHSCPTLTLPPAATSRLVAFLTSFTLINWATKPLT